MSPRVALVTGAARGIGAATVRQLAADGWAVTALDLCADDPAVPYRLATKADLLKTVDPLGDAGLAVVGDVRQLDDVRAAVNATVERFGGLDAVVSAAGVLVGAGSAWVTPEAAWEVLLDVNLTGTWQLARASIPALLARPEPRDGRFVAVSSAAGVRGLPQLAAYSASKHGVIGLVTSMAAELGSLGITANVVCPGSTDTDMLTASAAVYGLASKDEFAQHHLLPRLLQPEEIAAAIAFLCGPGASGMTGAVIPVDAGMDAK
jgi:SDR family mycofactocin-dependent oxidoreductase